MKLSDRDVERLTDVHPELQHVVYRAAELIDEDGFEFFVIEGRRTLDKQKTLRKKGASQTLRSRHVMEMNACGSVCAIDLGVKIDGELRWDFPLYDKLAGIVKEAAHIENVPVEWGGDWLKFKDGPHFQLPWSKYP